MEDINYFDIVFGGINGASYGIHSITDIEKTVKAIRIVTEYFHTSGTLAYRLEQAGAGGGSPGIALTEMSEGRRMLNILPKSHDDISKIKERFDIPANNNIDIEFEANMSHGIHPINMILYKLTQKNEQFDQYVFFSSPTGDETMPLHLGQIEEILKKAESEGFIVANWEELKQAKEGVLERYKGWRIPREEAIKQNMAYFAEGLKDELVELLFKH